MKHDDHSHENSYNLDESKSDNDHMIITGGNRADQYKQDITHIGLMNLASITDDNLSIINDDTPQQINGVGKLNYSLENITNFKHLHL
jgi:hypothetical protein